MSEELDLSQFDGHTPGPWKWDGDSLWHIGYGYDGPDPHLYTGINHDMRLSKSPVLEKNMRLIAAAPQLLEEVKKLRRFIALMGTRERAKWEQFRDYMEDENGKSTL